MGRIAVLPPEVAEKIAAGEVIERPASVVKELVENALDAGARRVEVWLENGGLSLIRVRDNGCGMSAEDLPVALRRHATSKIREAGDLWRLTTLGFRGEALPSIAAVSRLRICSRPAPAAGAGDGTAAAPAEATGHVIDAEGGVAGPVQPFGCAPGTEVWVRDLFYNVPARRKFLRSAQAEAGRCDEVLADLALSRPDVAFEFWRDGRLVWTTSGNGDPRAVFGAVRDPVLALEMRGPFPPAGPGVEPGVETLASPAALLALDTPRCQLYLAPASHSRPSRRWQSVLLNGRPVDSPMASKAVERAFGRRLMSRQYPVFLLYLWVPPGSVDVNVHPSKRQVRFQQEDSLFRLIYHTAEAGLYRMEAGGPWAAADGRDGRGRVPVYPSEEEPGTQPVAGSPPLQGNGATHGPESAGGSWSAAAVSWPGRLEEEAAATAYGAAAVSAAAGQSAAAPAAGRGPGVDVCLAGQSWRYVGQVWNTYLLWQSPQALLVVDQHAAHERVMYELFRRREAGPSAVQELLVPETLTLTAEEFQLWAQERELLERLGFFADPFGERTLLLRTVPMAGGRSMQPHVLRNLLAELAEARGTRWEQRDQEEALIRAACKQAAVKAGDPLAPQEAVALMEALAKTEHPDQCPHGRPTWRRFSASDLAGWFERH